MVYLRLTTVPPDLDMCFALLPFYLSKLVAIAIIFP